MMGTPRTRRSSGQQRRQSGTGFCQAPPAVAGLPMDQTRFEMRQTSLAHWAEIDRWLATYAPASRAVLLPPASAEDVFQLGQAVGVELSGELVQLYALHNGVAQAEADVRAYFYPKNYRPLPAQEAIQRHQILSDLLAGADDEMVGYWWHPLWVPIADHVTADALFIDYRPGPSFGQVGTFDHEDSAKIKWSSLSDFFASMRKQLEGTEESRYKPTIVDDSLIWRPPVKKRI